MARPLPRPAAPLTTEGGDSCPACGATCRAAINVGSHQLFECTACGCWSSDALARNASTSFAAENYFDNPAADRPRWADLVRRAGSPPPRTVLDVGCGNGAFLAFLAAALPGAAATGIELDDARAAEARAAHPGATVIAGDALREVERLTGQFDLITLWDVFEHVPAPGLLLKALARRLAPGGRLFIQTIHEASVLPAIGRWSYRLTGGLVRGLARRTHEAHHLVFFTRAGLDALAVRSGLRTTSVWFDRLARERMDGPALVTLGASALLDLEQAAGNGLFINAILEAAPAAR